MGKTLNELIEKSIKENWDLPSVADFQGDNYLYSDVAAIIAKYHIVWRNSGWKPGFKVAICGRNSATWAISFLAAVTYGAIPVPLLNEFTPDIIHRLVTHSEAKLFIVSKQVWEELDPEQMPNLEAIVMESNSHELLYSRNETFAQELAKAEESYSKQYPKGIAPDMINYFEQDPEELMMINYTSGTTSMPKGVMIPVRAMWSNMLFAFDALPNIKRGHRVVSLLPVAHLYGMSFEFLFEFCRGVEITFIPRALSPHIIMSALKEVSPNLVVLVPLILEKVIRKAIMPKYKSKKVQMMLKLPLIGNKIRQKFRDGLYKALGGNLYEVIVGGAALSPDVEEVLCDIKFPFTVGYGMTECAPIICYRDWHEFVPSSCGVMVPRMEMKILSSDPQNVPGELTVRGDNVMLGYYKNEEATKQAIDEDGWLHTGDMTVVDNDGNVFIRGRIKNMLLGASGQNIYPEELEQGVNALPYVLESVVVQRDNRLVALVYPNREDAARDGLKSDKAIQGVLESHKKDMNKHFPSYAPITAFELVEKEFEKTPKKSIKRFLYT